jgi:hypothetical protein
MSDAHTSPVTVTALELKALNDWMREPDFAENFSLEDISDWINRRPIHTTARLVGHAQSPAADGFVLVPQAALAWLNGEAPDPDGKWFGDDEEVNEQTPTKFYRKYWWRSKFRELCAVSSTDRAELPFHQETMTGLDALTIRTPVSRRDSGGSDG